MPVLALEKAQIQIVEQGKFYALQGKVTAFGSQPELRLPEVTVKLFNDNEAIDSTHLNSAGEFTFNRLSPGKYDLAFAGHQYFPEKICGIEIGSVLKIYPSVELQNLTEKYPDSTWRPESYLYVTFKSELSEEEIIRRLDWEYNLEILPFNSNSILRPILRFNGEKLYRATVILEENQDELKLAQKLVFDPYVYSVDPDLLLPLPPAVKTNQKPRATKK
jgi:hypothetical protein